MILVRRETAVFGFIWMPVSVSAEEVEAVTTTTEVEGVE